MVEGIELGVRETCSALGNMLLLTMADRVVCSSLELHSNSLHPQQAAQLHTCSSSEQQQDVQDGTVYFLD